MPSRMAVTWTPKLTNQDNPLSLAIEPSLFLIFRLLMKTPCRRLLSHRWSLYSAFFVIWYGCKLFKHSFRLCESCETPHSVFNEIKSAVESVYQQSLEVKDDLTYMIDFSREDYGPAHQLRFINQENARMDDLSGLTEHQVVLTQDWAMKYVPIKYRVLQNKWFGKRGLL